MKSALPLRDDLPVIESPGLPTVAQWTQTWKNYFNAIARAIVWNLSLTATKTHDFGLIAAGAEASTTITVAGARTMDTPSVLITPSANEAGIIFAGVVTADDTVTLYAKNFTAGGINPTSKTFRATVLQP